MSKYGPLTDYLTAQHGRSVRMSFAQVEAVLGQKLPQKSKAVRAWWSNNPSNNVMTRAWLAAGYRTAEVDIAGEMLSFVQQITAGGFGEMKQADFEAQPTIKTTGEAASKTVRHPALGALKGMITLRPDVDYTQPADPEWGKVYED